LLGLFGASALLLAAVGLYSVMAAYVRQRHEEIGIRLTLGATGSHVRRLVLGEGLRLALAAAARRAECSRRTLHAQTCPLSRAVRVTYAVKSGSDEA
jgi:hypothetical protein